jgi:hypothetical protein
MEKLKQILAQEDTVLFIGSGISLWSGLPSWSGLIEELAKFVESTGAKADLVRAEAQRGELLQAASYGFDKLTKQQIGDFIRVACRYGVAKPHEIHKKIVSLPLLQDAKPPLLENLKSVIKQAGTRHGRRYIFDSE